MQYSKPNKACGLRSFIAIKHPPHDTSWRQPCNTGYIAKLDIITLLFVYTFKHEQARTLEYN